MNPTIEQLKAGGGQHFTADQRRILGCARCGHVNDGTKRNRRFFAMEEFPDGSICGCCVGKARKGAKAS
jgi:hypothetical protein